MTKRPHREFGEFRYRADTWKQEERVIVKAEVTHGKLNPRFVVTDLSADDGWTPQAVYGLYCERGDAPERRPTTNDQRPTTNDGRPTTGEKALLRAVSGQPVSPAAARGRGRWSLVVGRVTRPIRDARLVVGRRSLVALLKVAARVIERYRVVRVQPPTSYPLRGVWRRLLAWLQSAPERPPGNILAVA